MSTEPGAHGAVRNSMCTLAPPVAEHVHTCSTCCRAYAPANLMSGQFVKLGSVSLLLHLVFAPTLSRLCTYSLPTLCSESPELTLCLCTPLCHSLPGTGYLETAFGASKCIDGSSPITSYADCRKAVRGDRDLDIRNLSSSSNPTGCMQNHIGMYLYNEHPAGQPNQYVKRICSSTYPRASTAALSLIEGSFMGWQ